VGRQAGQLSQKAYATAVGYAAGLTAQGTYTTAVGYTAGQTSQGTNAVAVGPNAGRDSQLAEAVAVGYGTGMTAQGIATTAVGVVAGQYNQGTSAVAVGRIAGNTSQGAEAVAVGYYAGQVSQKAAAVAIGPYAGQTAQATLSVAVGQTAGQTSQGNAAIAIGYAAGNLGQVNYAVAIGADAGRCYQGLYSAALGLQSGRQNQGTWSIALGTNCGQFNQGERCVAIGRAAGDTDQHNYSIIMNANDANLNTNAASAFFVKPLRSEGGAAMYYDTSSGEISYSSSDDRLKVKEVLIKDATTTLMKLSPQNYFKKFKLDEPAISHYESGLMAQDVWYDAPELRHTVHLGAYADPTPEKPPAPSQSLEDDPDYSAWGSDPAQVQYDQLIPYMIKSIQEIITELPRTKTTVSNAWGQTITGLIVSANMNTHKTNTTPIVALSNVHMDKKWYGVVSDKTTDTNDYDTLVDTKGDTQIWIADMGGSLESGDLVTTSNIAPGYAQKQVDEVIHNYTVAKVTQDCDFTVPTQRPIRVPKRELSNVTYYIEKTEFGIDLYDYEEILCEKHKTVKTETVYRKTKVNGLVEVYSDGDGNEVSKKKYKTLTENEGSKVTYTEETTSGYSDLTPEEQVEYTETVKNVYYRVDILESPVELEDGAYDEIEVRQELVDVLDENGQIVWEETGETEPLYTLVDHGTYKAALVSCKLI
jgi:hypothetical protein